MRTRTTIIICAALGCAALTASSQVVASNQNDRYGWNRAASKFPLPVASSNITLGPRPMFLVDDMDDGRLKQRLQSCEGQSLKKSDFSIGHRGAALQFPEHTKESYVAAARMGAGILECDVTFTKDRELVCRHSQCDLHTTTDIVAREDLRGNCTVPPQFDADGNLTNAGSIQCCTSDITLAQFKSLCGKMDASNPNATTVAGYLGGTANWRTDLYATCGTVLSHAESIDLFEELGVKMTPELKTPSVQMPYEGDYTQEDYAQQMIDEYVAAGVEPRKVFPQSFNYSDVLYWVNHTGYGDQAVYLDGRAYGETEEDRALFAGFDANDPASWQPRGMQQIAHDGVNIVAPPMWVLLTLDGSGEIVPSRYAESAKAAGLDIITWTLERSGPLASGGGWYHQSITDAVDNDGDTMTVMDVLARQVGIRGLFSDWPATTSFYANCMDIGFDHAAHPVRRR
ncbi:MAG: glycerophosphodiester phosphodiesterase [Gammaproteobacteria bacterium]|nr:glycerophosphodiester phosphodiesterase [Gammaproteobacteria bacterium]